MKEKVCKSVKEKEKKIFFWIEKIGHFLAIRLVTFLMNSDGEKKEKVCEKLWKRKRDNEREREKQPFTNNQALLGWKGVTFLIPNGNPVVSLPWFKPFPPAGESWYSYYMVTHKMLRMCKWKQRFSLVLG